MVLVVVLSVFGGFEQLMKDRVLSYTPHINIERIVSWPEPDEFSDYNPETEWRAVEKSMSNLDGVESAYALVNDWVLLDRNGAVAPASMQAIDTSNATQLKSLQELIQPGMGNADMGQGDNAVISSFTADKFGLKVGETIQVHTNRNLKQVQPVLSRIGEPSFAKTHPEDFKRIRKKIEDNITSKDGKETAPIETMIHIYDEELEPLLDLNIRDNEKELIVAIQEHLAEGERSTPKPDNSGVLTYPEGHKATIMQVFDSLAQLDIDKADINEVKNIKTLVLPRDITIIGIYQASQHVLSPEVFVPLNVGQDLAGLGAGVRGIALRLDDPYKATQVLNDSVLPVMADNDAWEARTWMQDHEAQFSVIKMQRQLLTFSLAFIMLVSAFSIMAVMFTVTIQKKREIGVMKALGAAPSQLVCVFLYQGVIIGLLGGVIGLGLGYLVLINRQSILDFFTNQLGFSPFSAEINGFEGLPAIINPSEFIQVFIFAFVMCVLATLVPALLASRSDAAKSLRNM